jgi:NitT/TauT family transport system permease protein
MKQMIRLMRILIFIIFLLTWEVCARNGVIDSFFFSSPSQIFSTFITMCREEALFLHIGITLIETLVSFLLVIIIGVTMTILLWQFPRVSSVLEPYLVVLNSLPKSALAPLLIVWFGTNIKTIIIAGISVAVFGSIINLYTGFREIEEDKVKLILTLGGRKKDVLCKVVLPASIPYLLSNMKVNIGLCLVGVIIGEFIGAKQGLGYLIIYGSQVFKLDWVIMAIAILCVMAMGLYSLINLLEKLYLKRV